MTEIATIDTNNLGRLAGDFSPKSKASINTIFRILKNDAPNQGCSSLGDY